MSLNRDNRVALVYPDYRGGDVFSGANLSVGLGYIAKALENEGVEYEVVDLNIDSIDYLKCRIKEFSPGFMGISMMSYRCRRTYELIEEIKYANPQMKIIAGGPHITANSQKAMMECKAIDIGILGEGEESIKELLRGVPFANIKGVLFREGNSVSFSGKRDFIHDLDKVPFPTYKGFRLEKYEQSMQLTSSRGCPYKCIFCGAPRILGKRWRSRSAESMVEEFEYWYKRDYRSFYFNDSNFAVNNKRVWDFCDEIIKRNVDATFTSAGLRCDHVDQALLRHMRRAGFINLTFGVESGSNKVLSNLRKGETKEQIETAISAATDLGFYVTLFFLIGSPGEEIEDIEQSFKLALKYNVAKVFFFNLTPIPGTEFYDWAVRMGYLDEYGERYPEGNFGFSNKALFNTDAMSADELTVCLKRARKVERQVQGKYLLNRVFDFVALHTGKNFVLRNAHLNALGYLLSFRGSKFVFSLFVRIPSRIIRYGITSSRKTECT